MGFDLYNRKNEYFRWNMSGWHWILGVALDHGWSPEGTRGGLEKDENGDFHMIDEGPADLEGIFSMTRLRLREKTRKILQLH